MNSFRLLPILALAFAPALSALPLAPDNDEASHMTQDSETGALGLAWFGVADRTYFIQHTSDLLSAWNYLPIIEQGSGAPLQYDFSISGNPPSLFFRLIRTDQPASDPYAADFDGDGIPNGWEIEHDLDPIEAADASATVGGLTNLARYQASLGEGTDPTAANSLGLILSTP